MRRLGSHLSVEGSADTLLSGLAVDVGTAMRLESVTLRTGPGGSAAPQRPCSPLAVSHSPPAAPNVRTTIFGAGSRSPVL